MVLGYEAMECYMLQLLEEEIGEESGDDIGG